MHDNDHLVRVLVPAAASSSDPAAVDVPALKMAAGGDDEALAEKFGLPVEFVRAALAITMALKSGMAVLVEPPATPKH